MGLTYFKRFRMEIALRGRQISPPPPPPGYRFVPWDPALLDSHARAKFLSFRDELDANVFPCLAELPGCRRLMREISQKTGFLAGATWLVVLGGTNGRRMEECGTIQGIRDRTGRGSMQNIGIAPEHRDRGLGTGLILRCLEGFRLAGVERVQLEVTAENLAAIRLYRRLGFRTLKTVYKAVEVACS